MNNAALTTKAQNSNANHGHVSTVTREGGCVTYRNIQDRRGDVALCQHAMVEPRKRVVLWGTTRGCKYTQGADGQFTRTEFIKPYRLEFRMGAVCEYDSYNLVYTGTIVAITEKTVTIAEDNGTKHRLSIAAFNRKNYDFDLEMIRKRNREWMD